MEELWQKHKYFDKTASISALCFNFLGDHVASIRRAFRHNATSWLQWLSDVVPTLPGRVIRHYPTSSCTAHESKKAKRAH